MFSKEFYRQLQNNPFFKVSLDDLAVKLTSYITNDSVKLDASRIQVVDYEDENNNKVGKIIKNLKLSRTQEYNRSSANGVFTQSITTDIVIGNPDYAVLFDSMNDTDPNIFKYALVADMGVEAPRVARHCQPGQFVIVKMDDKGERIPLTICDYDREAGTITIVFQEVGASTVKMADLKAGDSFRDFTGPLGCASELVEEDIEDLKKKKILFVAGGVGAAPVYPQVKWLHEHGVAADVIVGAKTKDMLILEDAMEAVSGNYYPCTDDGSYGHAGMVTTMVEELVNNGNKYDVCIAIGPMIMMKFVCLLTKKLEIPTVVSMNPIMVDGTGMCGACRLIVGDEVKFACVDGPEFDGHLVDFDNAMKRQQLYKTEEGRAMLKLQEGDTHHGGCGNCGGDK